jgi:hypothetical protein
MKQIKKISNLLIIAFLLLFGLFLFESCEKHSYLVETVNPGDSISLKTDVQPVFTDKCIGCHTGSGTAKLDLRAGKSYASLLNRGFITPPDSTCTLFVTIYRGHNATLLDNEKQKILIWVIQGAKNN